MPPLDSRGSACLSWGDLPMATQQQNWARLRADYGCPLRRGAWYRVVSISPLEAVVDVDQKPVLLPREYLEIVNTRPSRWTVVQEPERIGERFRGANCWRGSSSSGEPAWTGAAGPSAAAPWTAARALAG